MFRVTERLATLFRRKSPKKLLPSVDNVIASDFLQVDLPSDIPDLPGMISQAESRYLYWLSSDVYRGEGSMIEVGTWLGRSTVHLAAGLSKAHPGKILTCFDHFIWAGGANWGKSGTENQAGSDFMPDFLSNTQQYKGTIHAIKSKIVDIKIADKQVEIIVLDGPKRIKDISAILTQLAGRVMPEKTVLVWQDFMHAPSFEIAACLYAIADKIEPIHAVTQGSLMAFRVLNDWSASEVSSEALSFNRWSVGKAKEVWEYWAHFIPRATLIKSQYLR